MKREFFGRNTHKRTANLSRQQGLSISRSYLLSRITPLPRRSPITSMWNSTCDKNRYAASLATPSPLIETRRLPIPQPLRHLPAESTPKTVEKPVLIPCNSVSNMFLEDVSATWCQGIDRNIFHSQEAQQVVNVLVPTSSSKTFSNMSTNLLSTPRKTI